jgi:hypothetical protein
MINGPTFRKGRKLAGPAIGKSEPGPLAAAWTALSAWLHRLLLPGNSGDGYDGPNDEGRT